MSPSTIIVLYGTRINVFELVIPAPCWYETTKKKKNVDKMMSTI